jgi:hypothetical protein
MHDNVSTTRKARRNRKLSPGVFILLAVPWVVVPVLPSLIDFANPPLARRTVEPGRLRDRWLKACPPGSPVLLVEETIKSAGLQWSRATISAPYANNGEHVIMAAIQPPSWMSFTYGVQLKFYLDDNLNLRDITIARRSVRWP